MIYHRIRKGCYSILLLGLFLPICVVGQEKIVPVLPAEYFSPLSVLSFAEWLYHADKDFRRAGDEYSRYLFMVDHPTDSIQFRLAMSRKRDGDLTKAVPLFEVVPAQSEWRDRARFHSAHTMFLLGDYPNASAMASELFQREGSDQGPRACELAALSLLMQMKWDSAMKVAEVAMRRKDLLLFREYALLAQLGKELPKKDPVTAGFLSTLVPGVGRMYSGEWEDGIFSLIYVGVTAWLGFDGFQADGVRSVKGWLFGSLAGIFYAGNIHGSVMSARRMNARIENEFLGRIRSRGVQVGESE